jgi:muramidase (phage lysozyme)
MLDFIAAREAPKGYNTVYANRMAQMPKPLTSMTLAEVIADGPRRTKAFGSSAAGRYQFMTATLQDLRKSLVLMGDDLFSPDLQDRLGYALLQRRGYAKFMSGTMSATAFGLGLAQEWASFPVLTACKGASRTVARGQSYYAGDGVNKALVQPEAVEAMLASALAAHAVASGAPVVAPPQANSPALPPAATTVQTGGLWAAVVSLFKKAA